MTSSNSPNLLDQRPSFNCLAACLHSPFSAYRASFSKPSSWATFWQIEYPLVS